MKSALNTLFGGLPLYDVKVRMYAKIGVKKMTTKDVLALKLDSVISLNQEIASPIPVYINGKVIAYAEIIAIEDKFGLRIIQTIENS